jgi:hypothetical protein
MNNEELDIEIAVHVFGVSMEAIAAWPWVVPEFSTDRNYCSQVILRMFAHDARHIFDEKLESAAMALGWKTEPKYNGLGAAILVLTPDEICKAALAAIRENDQC